MQSDDLVTTVAAPVGVLRQRYGISPFGACKRCMQDGNLIGPASCQQHVLLLTFCWNPTPWPSQLYAVAAPAECELLNWLACVDGKPACTLHDNEGAGLRTKLHVGRQGTL